MTLQIEIKRSQPCKHACSKVTNRVNCVILVPITFSITIDAISFKKKFDPITLDPFDHLGSNLVRNKNIVFSSPVPGLVQIG